MNWKFLFLVLCLNGCLGMPKWLVEFDRLLTDYSGQRCCFSDSQGLWKHLEGITFDDLKANETLIMNRLVIMCRLTCIKSFASLVLRANGLNSKLLVDFYFLELVQQQAIAKKVAESICKTNVPIEAKLKEDFIKEQIELAIEKPIVSVQVIVKSWKVKEILEAFEHLGKMLLSKIPELTNHELHTIVASTVKDVHECEDLWDENEFPSFSEASCLMTVDSLRRFAIYWRWLIERIDEEGFLLAFPPSLDYKKTFIENIERVEFVSFEKTMACKHERENRNGKKECQECKIRIISLKNALFEFFGRFEGHFKSQLSHKVTKKINLKVLNDNSELAKKHFHSMIHESHVKVFEVFWEFTGKKLTDDIVEVRDYLHPFYGEHPEEYSPGVSYAKKHD